MNTENKIKALEAAIGQIEKQFGKGSIMRMNSGAITDVPVISTGSLRLDEALGIGGLPKGRVTEIFGPEASGKTTLTLHVVAETQRAGGVAAFIDAEHALDPAYARKLGVNVDDLLISQPDDGEQALTIIDTLVRSGAVDLVVVDSVAALVPRAEIEGEMGDSHVGLQARLMSHAMRKLTASISKSNTLVIFINQIRMKIGVMFGSPETTTGGNALKFFASIRIDIRRGTPIKEKEEVVGHNHKAKVVKNKLAPPFRSAEFDIDMVGGISISGEILDLAVDENLIDKSGSWFSYKGERLGQGRENTKRALRDNPDLMRELETQLRVNRGLPLRAGFFSAEAVPGTPLVSRKAPSPGSEAEGAMVESNEESLSETTTTPVSKPASTRTRRT